MNLLPITIMMVVITFFSVVSSSNGMTKTTDEESDPRIRYIFTIGIEATGHHFLNAVFEKSPIQEQMNRYDLEKMQKKTCLQLMKVYVIPCKVLPSGNHRGLMKKWFEESDVDTFYDDFVRDLKSLDAAIRENDLLGEWRNMATNKNVINFPINLLGGKIGCQISLPTMRNKQCRNLQYFSLGVFYKACDEANVSCGHVLMNRDPNEVVRSLSRRNFDYGSSAILTLNNKLQVLATQMTMFSDRLVACFDYDDATNGLYEWGEDNLFGWTVEDGGLERSLKDNYRIPSAKKSHDDNDKASLYMDSMIKSSAVVKNHCKEQLLRKKKKTLVFSLPKNRKKNTKMKV